MPTQIQFIITIFEYRLPQRLPDPLHGLGGILRGAEGGEAEEAFPVLAEAAAGGTYHLGLLQQDPQTWFARGASGDDDARIQALVDERTEAKKSRDFARADALRDQLAAEGIALEDTPQGVRWVRKRG